MYQGVGGGGRWKGGNFHYCTDGVSCPILSVKVQRYFSVTYSKILEFQILIDLVVTSYIHCMLFVTSTGRTNYQITSVHGLVSYPMRCKWNKQLLLINDYFHLINDNLHLQSILLSNSENHEHQKYLWNVIVQQGKSQLGLRKLNCEQQR